MLEHKASGDPILSRSNSFIKKREMKKMSKDEKDGVSPALLPLGNIGSLISGHAPNGVMVAGAKRKTSEGSNLFDPKDIKNLAQDLNNLCAKEYTRRLSGTHAIRDVTDIHDKDDSAKNPA